MPYTFTPEQQSYQRLRALIMCVCCMMANFIFATKESSAQGAPLISAITVTGNKNIPTKAILAKLPYRVGQRFKASLSSKLIKSLHDMGYFKPTSIKVYLNEDEAHNTEVEIALEEKDLVDEFIFEGNNHMKPDELDKKNHYSDIKAIDEDDLERLTMQIKQLYESKDYHDAEIQCKMVPTDQPGHVNVVCSITEKKPLIVREVHFTGNKHIASKVLRSIIFTREAWLFGFLSRAGTYQPEALEMDKYIIEHFYKSRGYLHAHVDDVTLERDPDRPSQLCVTFHVTEGDIYCIRDVVAEGNELKSASEILAYVPIQKGDLYSSERLRETMERLRLLWGEYGYIFAEINIIPEPHEEDRTVTIHIATTLGDPVECNTIRVNGNAKTREHVIRRELVVYEGEQITSRALDESKERVERLGFFDPQGGVNWKIKRINDKQADLELMLKEVKTGRFQVNFSTGGDPRNIASPATSFKVDVTLRDSNFLGSSIKYALTGTFSAQDLEVGLNLTKPWLFNRPLTGGLDIYHRKLTYDDFRRVKDSPREHTTGGGLTLGYTTPRFGEVSFLFDTGYENVQYNKVIAQGGANPIINALWQVILDNRFTSGNMIMLGTRAIQDKRNMPINTTRGYIWTSALKLALPFPNMQSFGFVKWDADFHWYTPLINEFDLIFHFHGHLGLIAELGKFPIPYRELYHIGGPATVRGFLFGQIGPTLLGDSLGAKKALWINAELIFPATKDFNIVGFAFYDGGAGWDTPTLRLSTPNEPVEKFFINELRGNSFHFRQAIGVGVKIRSPFPLSVAVGFKLDRIRGEPLNEVHFSTTVDY